MTAGHSANLLKRYALLAMLFASGALPAAVPIDQLKAAFLYNFTLFAEWPVPPGDAFNLCLYGAKPVVATEALVGKSVAGAPLRVRRPTQAEELRACHIVYIDGTDHAAQARARGALGDFPVLTISEVSEFNDRPATINLVIEDGRIAFDIDNQAAQRAGLKLSSRLLRLARRIY